MNHPILIGYLPTRKTYEIDITNSLDMFGTQVKQFLLEFQIFGDWKLVRSFLGIRQIWKQGGIAIADDAIGYQVQPYSRKVVLSTSPLKEFNYTAIQLAKLGRVYSNEPQWAISIHAIDE